MHNAADWVADRSGIAHGVRRRRPKPRRPRKAPAGAGYDRKRDLPALIALWPWEIEDLSLEAQQRLVVMLRRALRQERKRGIGGEWSYDVVRHARLLAAYKCEVASLETRLASQQEVDRLSARESRL